jgi:hypothetical protein
MAAAMQYRSVRISSGLRLCVLPLPLILNPKKRGGEDQK